MTRVVVVGGGIAGLSIAWELAAAGARVTLVRADRPRTSAVAAGMLAPMPESSMTPSLVRLASEALRYYPRFLEALEEDSQHDVGFRRCGVLRVAGDEAERVALREEVGTYEAAGLPSQWLDPASARQLAPGLPPSTAGGLFSFDEAQVQPAWLLEALEEAAFRRGVSFTSGEVAGLAATADGVTVEVRGLDAVGADRVVLAAGAWSSELGGPGVPVRPVKGQLLAFGDVSGPGPILFSGHDYLLTKPDGSVLLGGTMAEAGFSLQPDAAAEALRELLPRLWPPLQGAAATVRVGLRPASPDGLPICGPLPGQRAIYAFTGHHRNGFLLCPQGARLAARELLEGVSEPLFASLRPARFVGS
ncbi:MAG: glycine oxidase ThiO [Candidatus Dormibacteria bacterium]